MKEIVSAKITDTGGGFYLITGQLVDGKFFVANNIDDGVRVLNADYLKCWDGCDTVWLGDHTIEHCPEDFADMADIYAWLIENGCNVQSEYRSMLESLKAIGENK